MPIQVFASHSLLPDLIRRGGTAIDCGANVGDFSRLMVEQFGCKVIAYEASPVIFGRIPRLSGIEAHNVAVCGRSQPVTINLDDDSTRSSVLDDAGGNRKAVVVEGRSLTSLLDEASVTGDIEVLKLDIEGAELEVLDSLSDDLIRRIGQVTIEFHDFLGYHTTAEVEQRIERIGTLGFRELTWSRRRNTGDVLLVNGYRLSCFRHVLEQSIVRPARALRRRVQRTFRAVV